MKSPGYGPSAGVFLLQENRLNRPPRRKPLANGFFSLRCGSASVDRPAVVRPVLARASAACCRAATTRRSSCGMPIRRHPRRKLAKNVASAKTSAWCHEAPVSTCSNRAHCQVMSVQNTLPHSISLPTPPWADAATCGAYSITSAACARMGEES